MTNELEKQFFDTFGIEPKNISTGKCKYKITPEFCESNCLDCKNTIKEATYPQISDRIYLMLLATITCISSIEFPFSDIQKLKKDILKEVIKHQYGFDKHQVRTLFEEG